eukprot:5714621-Alexandrium_andersonii.AAC.1
MPGFRDFRRQVAVVCDLVRRTFSRERLLSQCFADDALKGHRSVFDGFEANIHNGRFGDIVDAVEALGKIETALRAGWNLKKYNFGKEYVSEPKKQGWRIDLKDVDDAITSADFWAQRGLLALLGNTARRLFAWVSSCDCHGSQEAYCRFLKEAGAPSELWTRSCPMCGRRAPAMATGEFRELLADLWSATDAEMVVLSTGLPRSARQLLLESGAAAREAFATYLDMKCAVYEQFPL